MTTKSPLQVKPVRRYIKPRYPSYNDPNPLAHPYARPYPFSKRFVQWALASGLVGGGAYNASAQQPSQDTLLKNPFIFETLGLPYRPPSYGTGVPEHLNEKQIRDAAFRAFAAEGIKLDSNYVWKKEFQSVTLDGYAPSNRLGFVVLNHNRLSGPDDKAIKRYRYYWEKDRLENIRTVLKKLDDRDSVNQALKFLIDNLDDSVPQVRKDKYRYLLDHLPKNIKRISKNQDFINLKIEGEFRNRNFSYLPELSAFADSIVLSRSKQFRNESLKRLSILRKNGFLYPVTINTFKDDIPKIDAIDNYYVEIAQLAFNLSGEPLTAKTQSRWDVLKHLQRFGDIGYFNFSMLHKPQINQDSAWDKLAVTIQTKENYFVTLGEIKTITNQALTHETYIVPLTLNGAHSIISDEIPPSVHCPTDPMSRQDWRKLDIATKNKLIKEYDAAWKGISGEIVAKQTELAIQYLESEIRQFIQWSKAQGKY